MCVTAGLTCLRVVVGGSTMPGGGRGGADRAMLDALVDGLTPSERAEVNRAIA
nr:MAG TPA: hypothetical protein [Caudoviricetes sp.]